MPTEEPTKTDFELNPNALLWVQALESGQYRQTRGYLSTEGAFCCLGVACDVALQNGVAMQVGEYHESDFTAVTYDEHTASLPDAVREWLGLRDGEGGYEPTGPDAIHRIYRSKLTLDNDERGHDFQRIAQTIRTTPSLFAS